MKFSIRHILRWFDSGAAAGEGERMAVGADRGRSARYARYVPFFAMHLACLAVLWVGVSPFAVGLAVAGYLLRMFAITAFYHRYFSHRTFHTSRAMQFAGGFIGAAAAQRGPLWWAAHHRVHHRLSDQPGDTHSPVQDTFWFSHCGWFLEEKNFASNHSGVPDLAKFPELRWLDRLDILPPLLWAIGCYGLGAVANAGWPAWGTSGAQCLIWGFFISTVVLYHGTFTINSLAHRFGSRDYETRDDSRNNAWLALLTLGEGWHNNHHFHPGTVRQGFRWWQLDPTYWVLLLLGRLGLVWGLRGVPQRVLDAAGRQGQGPTRALPEGS